MSGGAEAIPWLVRRCRQGQSLTSDLILVQDLEGLEPLPPSVCISGEDWPLVRATGEISLRAGLLDRPRCVALVPEEFSLPRDLAGRAWLGQSLTIEAHDRVAAVAGRFCQPIPPDLAAVALAHPNALRLIEARTLSAGVIRAAVIEEMIGCSVGASAQEVLSLWIGHGAPSLHSGLLHQTLSEKHGQIGRMLSWVAGDGDLERLMAAGAASDAAAASRVAPGLPLRDAHPELRRLVERTVRDQELERSALMERAEGLLAALDLVGDSPIKTPLLRGAYAQALSSCMAAAAEGRPSDPERLEGLRASLHADKEEVDLVSDLSRLARFTGAPIPAGDAFAWSATSDAAWADLALRRVRRALPSASRTIQLHGEQIVTAALARRDAWNAGFAEALSEDWDRVAANRSPSKPLPLHRVSQVLLQRLVGAGHHVLLLVLDGCDLSTFLELTAELEGEGIGVVTPDGLEGSLADDVRHLMPFGRGVAPLPTVTSHARRALFAGEIPGDSALDETEAHAANASGDRAAFARNASLGDIPRRLFLKGDLSDYTKLGQALATKTESLLAVVLNAVDDSLSSKEVTPAPPWTLAAVGATGILRTATRKGWTVLLTADHGHTPHVHADRKAGQRGAGTRFDTVERDGLICFERGPLPSRPLYLAHRVGWWTGSQRRGYHGGAGLEEVLVPLVFLGSGGQRPPPPDGGPGAAPLHVRGGVKVPAVGDDLPDDVQVCLTPPARRLVCLIRDAGRIAIPDLAEQTGLDINQVFGEAYGALRALGNAKVRPPFEIDGEVLIWTVSQHWSERLPEGPQRTFFLHLKEHGSMTEEEATRLFGNARKLRRFRRAMENPEVPFTVRIEPAPSGDLFVRDDR